MGFGGLIVDAMEAGKKAALVTGGSRGLGRHIALALSGIGYRVAVNYLKEEALALDAVRAMGQGAMALRADVGDIKQVKDMHRQIAHKWGRLDALINNAGLAGDDLLVRLKEEDWDRVIRTNLTGCFNTARTFFPLMRDSGGGHIVNISSRSGVSGKEGQAAYSASKAALLGLTYTLARELSGHNMRVNAVLPGYLPSDMGRTAERAMEEARAGSMLGRLSDMDEVSGFIAWLLKTENITGQVFTLDSRSHSTL
jgi:3-oxoacyl-[acyl-carrier protein] reductase